MTGDVVTELHRALVDALILSAKHSEHAPVTVAEIYQDLIPYRSVRALGFAMNADYEHALLQLLAGEQGLAQIEPPEVRQALQEELNSANPNVGIYRNYAACDVIVTVPDEMAIPAQPAKESAPPAEPAQAAQPGAAQLEAAFNSEASAALEAIRAFSARPSPPQPVRTESSAPPAAPKRAQPDLPVSLCVACNRSLPASKLVRFCPFCGTDQTVRKCGECGEKLEKGWKFCIACGRLNP